MENCRLLLVHGCLGVVIPGNREDLPPIVRVLGVELRIVHHRLVFTVRIIWILVLVKEVAQMKKKEVPTAAWFPPLACGSEICAAIAFATSEPGRCSLKWPEHPTA